ncbi:hypothetical protein FBUS_05190 [Fasciolopsis buskii]|uniref:Uncharacterized protein n=1 Tax=Fasciolopsis buskii TaxID=27845 RepID=A0A8E0RWP4_9TREM|nr:hypothetical protein FBUS_05190 [Fasciolopsis buski]
MVTYTKISGTKETNKTGQTKIWTPESSDNKVYAILTQWNQTRKVCTRRAYFSSVTADERKSRFYLLDGSSEGISLKFTSVGPITPGVLVYLPETQNVPLEQYRLGCVIRMHDIN